MKREDEKAVLYEGETPVKEGKEVTKAVEELLHINYQQFKQIAMIAQGEFWNLLNAKTADRTVILRTIFNTEAYNNIGAKLADRCKESNDRRNNAENSIIQYLNDVTADESDETSEELEIFKKNAIESGSAWDVEAMLSCIDKIIEADGGRLEQKNIDLKYAEQILNEQQDKAALAETNNKFITEFENLKKQKEILDGKKQETDELQKKLERQKKAVREVNPVYLNWDNKQKEIVETKNNIREKTKELEGAKEAAEAARTQFAQVEKRQSDADKLKSDIDRINGEIPKYKERDEQNIKLKKCEDELTKIEVQNVKLAKEETGLKNKIEILEKEAETLKGTPEKIIHAENFGEKIVRFKGKLQEILQINYSKFENMQTALMRAQSALKSAQKQFDEANEKSRMAERVLENCRAGLLADGLAEGEPCPVCGSVHHPQLASLPEEAVTEEELKDLKDAENKAAEKKNEAANKATSANTALEQYESQLTKDLREVLDEYEREILRGNIAPDELQEYFAAADRDAKYENVDDMKHVADLAYSEILDIEKKNADEQETLKKACEEKKKTEKALEEAKGRESDALDVRKKELSNRLTENKEATAAAQAALEQLNNLTYAGLEEAEKECKKKQKALDEIKEFIRKATEDKEMSESRFTEISATLNTLNDAFKKQTADEARLHNKLDTVLHDKGFATVEEMLGFVVTEDEIAFSDEKINKYNTDVATNKKQLEEAAKNAEGKELVDVAELKKICEQQKAKVDEIRKYKNRIENRIETNKEKKRNIGSQKEVYEVAKKEYSDCEKLRKLVVGGITGKEKITLEQYIQAAGFDSIIAAANQRLLPMSGGQFELYRQKASRDKGTSEFLDLEVLDNYTGHRRPVGSLSGGESFMASLALALGLSDTVSSHLGGVQMDALFVDEGFGTLDRKSIDNAMEILLRLAGTNKLVGVISHREELVESIPQQIKVTKTREGSRFSVESGA
jgi:exonuclease SbcC